MLQFITQTQRSVELHGSKIFIHQILLILIMIDRYSNTEMNFDFFIFYQCFLAFSSLCIFYKVLLYFLLNFLVFLDAFLYDYFLKTFLMRPQKPLEEILHHHPAGSRSEQRFKLINSSFNSILHLPSEVFLLHQPSREIFQSLKKQIIVLQLCRSLVIHMP